LLSVSDDTTKPGKRKRSHWGDDERDAVGREHRRRTSPHGCPIVEPTRADVDELAATYGESDGTPHDDLPADAELTGPSDLVLDNPVALELWGHIERVARRGVRRHRDASDRIAQVHADAGNQHLGARISKVEKQLKWWQSIALSALVTAAGSLVAVGKGLFERGEREGRDGARLEQVERAYEQLRTDYRELRHVIDDRGRRYFDTSPTGASWSFPQPAAPAASMSPAPPKDLSKGIKP
jgi:hypothetical protein